MTDAPRRAESINDTEVVAANCDRQLLAAWRALGMNTLDVNEQWPVVLT